MEAKAEANLDAKVKLSGSKSQTFLVIALTVPTTLAALSAYLALNDERIFAGAFLFSSLIAYGILAHLWTRSHANQDLANANPVTLKTQSGIELSADPRTLADPAFLQAFATTMTTMLTIQPLPPASGVIDDAGNIVPNSADRANIVVSELNHRTQQSVNQFIDRTRVGLQVEPSFAAQSLTASIDSDRREDQ